MALPKNQIKQETPVRPKEGWYAGEGGLRDEQAKADEQIKRLESNASDPEVVQEVKDAIENLELTDEVKSWYLERIKSTVDSMLSELSETSISKAMPLSEIENRIHAWKRVGEASAYAIAVYVVHVKDNVEDYLIPKGQYAEYSAMSDSAKRSYKAKVVKEWVQNTFGLDISTTGKYERALRFWGKDAFTGKLAGRFHVVSEFIPAANAIRKAKEKINQFTDPNRIPAELLNPEETIHNILHLAETMSKTEARREAEKIRDRLNPKEKSNKQKGAITTNVKKAVRDHLIEAIGEELYNDEEINKIISRLIEAVVARKTNQGSKKLNGAGAV
jgi:hypothetical protein